VKNIKMNGEWIAWALVTEDGILLDVIDDNNPSFVAVYSTRKAAIKDRASNERVAKVRIVPA
jgi:hypothetical protein